MKGKEKCEKLKSIRKIIAERNGIDYTPADCNHEGECKGVCPACDRETEYVMGEIQKRLEKGLPVDMDIDMLEQLEEEDEELSITDENIEIDTTKGIIPDEEYLMGESQPVEYFLQGDIAAPDDFLESQDDEDEKNN